MNRSLQTLDPRTAAPLELATHLFDHYEKFSPQVYHYYGLLAIYGLCRTAILKKDTQLIQRCVDLLSRFPMQIDHSQYNVQSYRIGGIPRAYMLHQGLMTDAMTRRYVAHYAEEAMLAPRDAHGVFSHPYRPRMQQIWIDIAMAVAPFLLYAGLAHDRQDWIEEGTRQAILHYETFLDRSTGLLFQCKNFVGPGRFSQDHWGRGNGWGYIALTELVQGLPKDSSSRSQVEKYFRDLSQTLLSYQGPRGLWRQNISSPQAWEESSCTALILYGLGVGMRLGVLDKTRYLDAFKRGMAGLREYCINPDGSTELCCPGCLCPGEGERKGTAQAYIEDKQPVRDDGHSFGPLMLALTEEAQMN